MGQQSLWEIFFSATGGRTLAFGYRRYGRRALTTAGLHYFWYTEREGGRLFAA